MQQRYRIKNLLIPTRFFVPIVVAGVVAGVGVVYCAFSSLSLRRSRHVFHPAKISTSQSAGDVCIFLRDPRLYLPLTFESKYTVLSTETTSAGIEYRLQHLVSDTRSLTTEYTRDWIDAQRIFLDRFPGLGAPFKVLMKVWDEDSREVKMRLRLKSRHRLDSDRS